MNFSLNFLDGSSLTLATTFLPEPYRCSGILVSGCTVVGFSYRLKLFSGNIRSPFYIRPLPIHTPSFTSSFLFCFPFRGGFGSFHYTPVVSGSHRWRAVGGGPGCFEDSSRPFGSRRTTRGHRLKSSGGPCQGMTSGSSLLSLRLAT